MKLIILVRTCLQQVKSNSVGNLTFFRINYLYQLPHMLPSEEAFAAAVSALGVMNKDDIVVYDGKGIFSAARVWW